MPIYDPPDAHYSEIDVKKYSKKQMLKAIGKEGSNFKMLTQRNNLKYIWWDQKRNKVELWGSFTSIKNSKLKIEKFLRRY